MKPVVSLLCLALFTPPSVAGEDAAPTAGQGFDAFFLLQGIGRIAHHDPAGLGSEAGRANDWATGRDSLLLLESAEGWELADGEARHALSREFGLALSRLRDYMRLSAQARIQPVSTAELTAAAPGSERGFRDLFDEAISQAVLIDGEPIVPELGGDAVLLDGVIVLSTYVDPTREALVAVARNQDDPDALAEMFAEKPESLALLDVNGQLEREVALFRERAERGIPLERRRRPFDMAVETILRNGSDSFTMHPRRQLESVIARDWSRGRLIGLWHLHPPSWGAEGFVGAAPPSPDDRQIARANGQFLTLVFQPDGFLLHDLQTTPLGPAPPATADRRIEHVSDDWREHFARRHREWRERLTTSPSD